MKRLLFLFLIIQILIRLALWCFDYQEVSFFSLLLSQAIALVFDGVVFAYFFLIYQSYFNFLPTRWYGSRIAKSFEAFSYFTFINLLLFDAIAECIFWEEFHARFNFIAVDYLVYTHEVLQNIWESYPIVWMLSGLFAISGGIFYLSFKASEPAPIRRWKPFLITLALISLSFFLPKNLSDWSKNHYANELAKNGIYSLFSAFWMNELSFQQFYLQEFEHRKPDTLQEILKRHHPKPIAFHDPQNTNLILRRIQNDGPELHKNVILVVMESMSFSFMEKGGEPNHLTPVLDSLAKQGLLFSNTYATGTRTVRGLEAITLSIPPGPGSSIVKRPKNENLFSLGFLFQERGYDTRFIYGGYGYFDNMNYFFAHNGFKTVDRANFSPEEKTFANAWGLCDEDLFHKVIQEANQSYAAHHPFFHVVMTTSNHRPYTFPEGRINAPHTGGHRIPAVQYADFAIGELIKNAQKEPWFNNTVFVFVADHTASSAGKWAVTPEKHRIPFIIYSPGFIKPEEISQLTSQIDVGPTLLALLNFSYDSRFFGKDARDTRFKKPYAFVSNVQHLGYLSQEDFIILHSGKNVSIHSPEPGSAGNSVREAIRFYEQASDWQKHRR